MKLQKPVRTGFRLNFEVKCVKGQPARGAFIFSTLWWPQEVPSRTVAVGREVTAEVSVSFYLCEDSRGGTEEEKYLPSVPFLEIVDKKIICSSRNSYVPLC